MDARGYMVIKDVEKAKVIMTSLPHSLVGSSVTHLGWRTDMRQNESSIIKERMVRLSVWGQVGSTHRACPV